MSAGSGGGKKVGALALLVVGILADLVGIAGALGDWGSSTTEIVLAAEPGPTTTTSRAATTTTTVLEVETPEEFLDALAQAFIEGDAEFATERLHDAVIERYGVAQCRETRPSVPDPTAKFVIRSTASATAEYEWTTDGQTTVVPDVLTVTVDRTASGTTARADVHIALVDGTYRYFSDCTPPTA